MDILHFFREPVNAWSHCSGLLLALPGTYWLWRRSHGERSKQWSFLVFGLSLAFCYASSTLYHGVRTTDQGLAFFNLMDYIGIYLLIAGSYTPVAWNLLRGRWRSATLLAAWATAALGIALQLVYRTLPQLVSTGLYLLMGWGSIFCYFEIARAMTHRPLRLILWGGVLYTVGAVINVLEWPTLWRGVFGPHELFHMFVVAGSLAHFAFMLKVVASSSLATAGSPTVAARRVPGFTVALTQAVRGTADRFSGTLVPKPIRQ